MTGEILNRCFDAELGAEQLRHHAKTLTVRTTCSSIVFRRAIVKAPRIERSEEKKRGRAQRILRYPKVASSGLCSESERLWVLIVVGKVWCGQPTDPRLPP